MRLIAFFEDGPGMMEHRKKYEHAHIAYLSEHQSEIPIAGGLRPEPDGTFVGGLWVLDVESFERAEALIHNDPYYAPELRTYRLLVWGKALDVEVVL